MKIFTKYLIIALFSIFFVVPQLRAQSFDANRMNRDIRIMENILMELFRPEGNSFSAENIVFSQGFYRLRGVRGTYLKDYGIIFTIPSDDPMRPRLHISNNEEDSYVYSSDADGEDQAMKKEEVVNLLTEFLMNYASTIGQLGDNENIMIIYGANATSSYRGYVLVTSGISVSDNKSQEASVISVSAQVKDLRDYRSGKISEAKLKERIHVTTSKDREYTDLKVMSNIFETALEEVEGSGFRMLRGANYMLFDNFGAIFSFDVRFSTGSALLRETQQMLRYRFGESAPTSSRGRSITDEERKGLEEAAAQEQKKLEQQIIEAYSQLKTNLSEYLVDYGRTITSINNDQFILTSVTVSGTRVEEIPERVDFQVKKSVLEDFDRGKISREQAINQVVITEY